MNSLIISAPRAARIIDACDDPKCYYHQYRWQGHSDLTHSEFHQAEKERHEVTILAYQWHREHPGRHEDCPYCPDAERLERILGLA